MKRTLAIALATLLLTACSGLNASWVATASYNTPASTTAVMTPGGVLPLPVPVVKP